MSSAHASRSLPGRAQPAGTDDPSYLPREADDFTPAARFARVGAERNSAAAQIQRSLRVWRKAADEGDQKENEENAEDKENKEGEEKADGEKEGEGKEAEGEEKADEKEAPPVQAKLQGVGLKIFRAAEGNQKDTGVVDRAQRMIGAGQAKDMEDALNKLYDQTSGEERNKVKRTQKAFGFRHSRQS